MIPDFQITDHGSVCVFVPLTQRAREHIDQQIQPEGWQRVGEGFAVDHHLAADLVQQLVEDGFRI